VLEELDLELFELYHSGKTQAERLCTEQRQQLSQAQQRLLAQAQRPLTRESVFGDLVQRADLAELVAEWRTLKDNQSAEKQARIQVAPDRALA